MIAVNGTALETTYCRKALISEGASGKRADMVSVAFQHGVYVSPRHWSAARLMRLRTILDQSTQAGFHTQLQGLEKLLYNGTPTLSRTDPAAGAVQCEILVADPVEQQDGDGRMVFDWPVWQVKGYWEQTTPSHDVTDETLGAAGDLTAVSVGGSHPTEPVFTVTCKSDGANPAIEDPATGDKLVLGASFTTGDVIVVDVPARTVKLNGTRVKNLVGVNRGHWMEFAAGATVNLDFTSDSGTWDVETVVGYRWRG